MLKPIVHLGIIQGLCVCTVLGKRKPVSLAVISSTLNR